MKMKLWLISLLYGGCSLLLGIIFGKMAMPFADIKPNTWQSFVMYVCLFFIFIAVSLMLVDYIAGREKEMGWRK